MNNAISSLEDEDIVLTCAEKQQQAAIKMRRREPLEEYELDIADQLKLTGEPLSEPSKQSFRPCARQVKSAPIVSQDNLDEDEEIQSPTKSQSGSQINRAYVEIVQRKRFQEIEG